MIPDNLTRQVRLWHRRFGLVLLIWIILVAATGIVLNHSADLTLGNARLSPGVAGALYDIEPPQITALHLGNSLWISHAGGDQLFINDTRVARCDALSGAAATDREIYIACDGQVLVFSHENHLIEQLKPGIGLPVQPGILGRCDGLPCLAGSEGQYQLNPESLDWQGSDAPLQPPEWRSPPSAIIDAIRPLAVPEEFSWERLIRDLHSGILFGAGPWLMDAFAISLILLGISGLVLWRAKPNGKRR